MEFEKKKRVAEQNHKQLTASYEEAGRKTTKHQKVNSIIRWTILENNITNHQ
jgi:hypothetical protein